LAWIAGQTDRLVTRTRLAVTITRVSVRSLRQTGAAVKVKPAFMKVAFVAGASSERLHDRRAFATL
jgi:hypothetical protein